MQAKDASAPVAAMQKVVKIISSDQAKIRIYRADGKLGAEIEDVNEAKYRKPAMH